MSLLRNFEELESSINPIKEIKEFIKDNYITSGQLKISRVPNENGKYIVKCNHVKVNRLNHPTSLTNGMFEWGITNHFDCSCCEKLISLEGAPEMVDGDFDCSYCKSLTSLEGGPEKVVGDFNCSRCVTLTSLEGAPKYVGKNFNCGNCESLISLKGVSKEVKWSFFCYHCKSLTSLEGAPKEINGCFDCYSCPSLKSLNGAPKRVSRCFYCFNCGGHFMVEDVKKVCNVGMEISANDIERYFYKKI